MENGRLRNASYEQPTQQLLTTTNIHDETLAEDGHCGGGGGSKPQSLYTLIASYAQPPAAMISRRCRNVIVGCLLLYLLVLLVYSNVALFRKCTRCNQQTLLEVNFHVKQDGAGGDGYILEGSETAVVGDGRVVKSSNGIIFINRNEYESGRGLVGMMEETTIKRSGDSDGITVENLHKMYHPAVPAKKKTIREQQQQLKQQDEQKQQQPPSQQQQKETNARKKFIFSLRYYEQLSMATKNLLSLASLATHTNSHLVMPFVNNSRFSGLRLGVSMSSYLEASKYNRTYLQNNLNGGKFNNLDKYFDVGHLNRRLTENGYNKLATFDEFQRECRTLDTVVHFLYDDELTTKNLERWYKVPPSRSNAIIKRAKANNGWTECDFIKRSKITHLLGGVNVSR